MQELQTRLHALLAQALKRKASDIHFTLMGSDLKLELRTGKGMETITVKSGDHKLLPFLQYRANLDIGNSAIAQSGQFEELVMDRHLSLRFACINRLDFVSGVLRILNSELPIAAGQLSLLPGQNQYFASLLQKRNGLFLFSGATGSGKTTSLYSLLQLAKGKKIYSLEDPVEIYFEQLVQLNLVEETGFDYMAGIKQILRHDPDIILIGEIRDEKAAHAALRAANTGHLVFSSIHASSASLGIERMKELGIKSQNLYDVLLGVSCQSLVSYKGCKYALYEIMDDKDLAYYHRYHRLPNNFFTIQKQLDNLYA